MTTQEETSKTADDKKQGLLSSMRHGIGAAASSLSHAGLSGTDKLGKGYGKALGFYDKLFLKHINRDFGDHLEVASRGACFVVLCAIPFITPAEFCPLCREIVQEEIYTSACVTYFIYTLYLHTGDIINFAQGGVMGTLLAVFNIWLMQGFMPGGYTPSMPHRWYMGSLWGIMFTFLILWLNFNDNTRIFGLSTYVWYWMTFIQPDATAGFSQNFQVKLDGRAVREFMVAAIGCGIALLAAYVPYPIYAHTTALETAKRMLTQVYMTKQDFLTFYSGSKADDMTIKILAREVQTLQSQTGVIDGLLDSAWFECLGMGKAQKQRVMMKKFSAYVSKTVDLLSNIFQICQSEEFDPDHVKTMAAITEPLQKVIDSNSEVLKYCVAGLYEASFSEEIQALAEKEMEMAREGLKEVTSKLLASRAETGYNKVSEESSGENVAALTYAKFTHLTREFYADLQGEQVEKRGTGAGVLGLFDPDVIYDREHIMWTLRNTLSIVISFYIGWHGYGKYIASYNAAIASTVAVLLSKFAGSAMIKNLARLQGVVIGIVLGNLLYAFLGWCYWWGHLLTGVALYFWTLMGLFMYFHSTNYSTVGLLLAVFGSQALLKPCANENTDPSGQSSIVNVTVGIVVMTLVDLVLSPARASDMAIGKFQKACVAVVEAVEKLFDSSVTTIEERGSALIGVIGAAQFMGNEAALEPRYWRHAWPAAKFNRAISCLKTLRFCLDSIENIMLDKDGKKT
jgi:hypothetical protein